MGANVHALGEPDESERKVVKHLRDHLTSEYDLYHNLDLKGAVGFAKECDVVVLGPMGCEIVEVKNYHGVIRGNQASWMFSDGKTISSPFPTLNRKARILRSLFERNRSDVRVSLCIAYVEQASKFAINDPQHDLIFHHAQLATRYLGSSRDVPEGELVRAREVLLSQVPSAPKANRFESYEILYEIRKEEGERVIVVTNPSIPHFAPRRLKLLAFDVYQNAAERKQMMETVVREFALLQKVPPHPNIMKPLAGDFYRNEYFGVQFEHVEGQPLSGVLAEHEKIAAKARLEIVIGVARGLAHAHRYQVVHRLLTPERIWLAKDGRALVTDFDSARDLSRTLATLGPSVFDKLSPRYAAPEAGSPGLASERSDVYSVGAVLHDLFRKGATVPSEEKRVVLDEPYDVPGQMEKDIRGVVRRAMEGDPEKRYATLDELADELSVLL
jgi:serine/threonine protein kinase